MTRRVLAAVCALAVALLMPACVRGGRPRWSATAFYAPYDQYRVRARADVPEGDAAVRLVGPGWRLVPPPRWVRAELPPDLHAEHSADGSQILVETLPLDDRQAGRDLRYLAEDLLAALAVSVARLRAPYGARPVIPAVRVLFAGPATVGGADAWIVVHDLGPGSERGELVVVRGPRDRLFHPHEPGRANGRPTVVVFALTARGDTFDAHAAEFDALLSRVDVRAAEGASMAAAHP